MKQVRFDTPRRSDSRLRSCDAQMYESPDCQEPRALVATRMLPTAVVLRYSTERPATYSSDPVERYELSDSTPHPTVSKTVLPTIEKRPSEPSLELELSRLDGGESSLVGNARRYSADCRPFRPPENIHRLDHYPNELSPSLKIADNTALPNTFHMDALFKETQGPTNKTNDGGMFIHSMRPTNTFTVPSWKLPSKSASHNVNPLKAKVDLANILSANSFPSRNIVNNDQRKHCDCHECVRKYNKEKFSTYPLTDFQPHKLNHNRARCCCMFQRKQDDILEPSLYSPCSVQPTACSHSPAPQCYQYCSHPTREKQSPKCGTKSNCCPPKTSTPVSPINTVEAKTRAIEKYEQMNKAAEGCVEVEKQANVIKEQRQPTVSDLFQIIKIQNEQLMLLQDRVDKLLVSSQHKPMDNTSTPFRPVQNFVQERVAVETLNDNHHKISIGVMTSFEMVRTATKERAVKNTSQIQCNRSQVSIKEVIATAEQCNLNFLDGIAPVDQNANTNMLNDNDLNKQDMDTNRTNRTPLHRESLYKGNEEKTLNELSLCNFQLDNAVTPQLSPDQTIYLDVKDYSDSDNEDESGVGWTYYNKVMSHVNELLQESGVPSSAGALHRRAVAAAAAEAGAGAGGDARCRRLHVDRTDLSVTTSKRVTFGHHPMDAPKQFSRPVASSDTSLQMNRLAAKYLRKATAPVRPVVQPQDVPLDMSLATRRYMEQHNLLQNGVPASAPTMPVKFLDITALKQQPKLL